MPTIKSSIEIGIVEEVSEETIEELKNVNDIETDEELVELWEETTKDRFRSEEADKFNVSVEADFED